MSHIDEVRFADLLASASSGGFYASETVPVVLDPLDTSKTERFVFPKLARPTNNRRVDASGIVNDRGRSIMVEACTPRVDDEGNAGRCALMDGYQGQGWTRSASDYRRVVKYGQKMEWMGGFVEPMVLHDLQHDAMKLNHIAKQVRDSVSEAKAAALKETAESLGFIVEERYMATFQVPDGVRLTGQEVNDVLIHLGFMEPFEASLTPEWWAFKGYRTDFCQQYLDATVSFKDMNDSPLFELRQACERYVGEGE